MSKTLLAALLVFAIVSLPIVFADSEEKLEFGSELQETLGHFWALEQNLDENNAELVISTEVVDDNEQAVKGLEDVFQMMSEGLKKLHEKKVI